MSAANDVRKEIVTKALTTALGDLQHMMHMIIDDVASNIWYRHYVDRHELLVAENELLRFHLKNMVELADEFTPEEPDDYASDLRHIAEARAILQPKEDK